MPSAKDKGDSNRGTDLGRWRTRGDVKAAYALPVGMPRLHARYGYELGLGGDRGTATGFHEIAFGLLWSVDPWLRDGAQRWNFAG